MRQNLLFNAFLILSILFVACEKDDPQPAPRPNPEPAVVDSYDFNAVIAADYHRIESSYDDFMFFESHALFADSINTLTRPIIISMNTIFQVADTVITIEHLENQFDAEPVVTKVTTGVIGDISSWIDYNIHNVWVVGIISGLLSGLVDTFTVAMTNISLYPVVDSAQIGQWVDSEYMSHFTLNGLYWQVVAYCTAIGGCLLSVGSTSGLALMRMEHVHLGWYLKTLTPKVLIGFFAGLVVLYLENLLTI